MPYLLPKSELGAWLAKLSEHKTLVAPRRDAQGRIEFAIVKEPQEIVLEPGVVPEGIKRWLNPPSEEMFRYAGAGPNVRVGEKPPAERELVIFGVRLCDAAALAIVDEFWASETGDPYYERRRAHALIIAVNCTEAVPECFCEALCSALSQPQGMDILLTPLNDEQYLVESFTERGAAALEATASLLQPTELEAEAIRKELAASVAAQQKRRLPSEGLSEAIQRVFSEEAFWQQHTAACIGCGVCTFLCPTCTCFDVMDDAIAGTGYRYRCWDTCQFRQFCEEASGHDRRPQQWQRQRQRIAHKLWFWADRFGKLSCVGCGRCVKLCPVNIDITKIASDALETQPAETKA